VNNVVKRAKEHVWYSHDAPLVQELLDEIERLHLEIQMASGTIQAAAQMADEKYDEVERLQNKITTMATATSYMYDYMSDSRKALKAQRNTYKQRLEDAMEVLRSVSAQRDELLASLTNASEVAKEATEEIIQLRKTLAACRATIDILLENPNDRV
jgi:chromosome segregation ATPase